MNDIGVAQPDRADMSSDAAPAPTVAEALARALRALGVRQAYGVSGGAQALLWAALSRHLDLLHFRHESGAAFAATEAHFASGCPVVAFATTGPGITNALTGMLAARTEGAKVILLSAYGSAAHRGRGGIQETSSYTMPTSGLFEPGAWFDDAVVIETPDQLPQVLRRLAAGLARPGGYVAHLSVPTAIQGALFTQAMPPLPPEAPGPPIASPAVIARCVTLLSGAPLAIWAGFGARGAATAVQALAERIGAPVICSPRAKGVIPEDHPLFLGVTGMGGHAATIIAQLRELAPRRILVLGTRLGEPTSFWSPALVPPGGFVHVDIDPGVPGTAYPQAETYAVQAEVGAFLDALLAAWPEPDSASRSWQRPGRPHPAHPSAQPSALLRPEVLMGAVQRIVLDGSEALVLAESGNAFTWATHYLRMPGPGRYRVSTNLGSMGHVAAGVVGAALGAGRKAVAILGDGAMLMNSGEVSTAVKRQAPAVWIVLNDGRYNMCHQGMAALGMAGAADTQFPPADFAMLARAMGAEGLRVGDEMALDAALAHAMAVPGPVVIDALIDADRPAPSHGRNEGLSVASVATRATAAAPVSFPVIASH